MGINKLGHPFFEHFNKPSLLDQREIDLAQKRREEERAAAIELAHEMANLQCPEDIKQFGRRHGIPNFAEVVWNAGFLAGYRQQRRDDRSAEEGEAR